MAESPEDLHTRVTAALGPDGRPPAPEAVGWDIFPWEVVDGAVGVRRLLPPAPEEPREGEGARECRACAVPPDHVVWEDEHWQLIHLGRPSGLPVVLFLNTREHLDHGQLPDDLASEHGRILNRLVRIVESLDGVSRCHLYRYGDGSAHAHTWVVARPADQPSIRGSWTIEWDDLLPPVPEDLWRRDLVTIATKLANWGGEVRAT
ncbi:MAG TPA: hypothetical protein VGE43_06760 [Acidimicrobiales bacterium]